MSADKVKKLSEILKDLKGGFIQRNQAEEEIIALFKSCVPNEMYEIEEPYDVMDSNTLANAEGFNLCRQKVLDSVEGI